MRTDVYTELETYYLHNINRPNYAKIARLLEADPRTVKRYYESLHKTGKMPPRRRRSYTSVLDDYKSIIRTEICQGTSARSIYNLISNIGYQGSYRTVCLYVHKTKQIQFSENNPII